MPHYDESFFLEDNQNQRRNKRSYRVYKTGLSPMGLLERHDMLHALEERVIKRNLRRKPPEVRRPDIIAAHCPPITPITRSTFNPQKYLDLRNNNTLTPCKSFDNLTLKESKKKEAKSKLRNGVSLYNLSGEGRLKHYVSPGEETVTRRDDDVRNSYSVLGLSRRGLQPSPAPGPGVYRPLPDLPTTTSKRESEGGEGVAAWGGAGGSLRGANKLARRARSFKDDLIERINNMRSPHQPHGPHGPHLNHNRSSSPLSPKLRIAGGAGGKPPLPVAPDDEESTPAKDLERLVKEVKVGLIHFSDVITKRKLEMLPGNGTLVFESIANIHRAIKPYCARSPQLSAAVAQLCGALAALVRLCDDVTALSLRESGRGLGPGDQGDVEPDLAPSTQRAQEVVRALTHQVERVCALGVQHMSRPALAPRPATTTTAASANASQRNSLPDIPLSSKELSVLRAGVGAAGDPPAAAPPGGPRGSHSTESVLDAPDEPPPKPARPIRKIELAPPLPPKRRSNNDNGTCLPALSMDRVSLVSDSSGSLDSVLNASHDDNELFTQNNHNHSHSHSGVCGCNNVAGELADLQPNHNRFSNESGFVSVGHAETSAEHSFTSSHHSHHRYSDHTDSTEEFSSCVQTRCSSVRVINTSLSAQALTTTTTSGTAMVCAYVGADTPPELPKKTRRRDIAQDFPDVEIRAMAVGVGGTCGDRPHTLAEHTPPPLPLKKKHMFQSVAYSVMAYMEMFGNCSHPAGVGGVQGTAPPADMFRHSIHTYNLTSTGGGAGVGGGGGVGTAVRQHHVHIAQSYTLQHIALSGSDESMSSSGTSPVPGGLPVVMPPDPPSTSPPHTPPALPPKTKKKPQSTITNDLSLAPSPPAPASPRLHSHNSTASNDDAHLNSNLDESYSLTPSPGKFPLDDSLEPEPEPEPAPVRSRTPEQGCMEADIILSTDVSPWVMLKSGERGEAEVRGGHPDALIVLATKATKDFAYQEAFLATYRTFVSPAALVSRLTRRARHVRTRTSDLRPTLALLTRVVADLTMNEVEDSALMAELQHLIYWLVEGEELSIAKALRQILVEKQRQLHFQNCNHKYEYESPCAGSVSLRRDTLLEFKSLELAEQMTLLDAALFARLTAAEVLAWPRDQSEENSPNLTRFTAHFNKMSYWARSRILEQEEAREREKYAHKLLKTMLALRKLNNFNSYLALVSALDSPPVRRLGWPSSVHQALDQCCAIIEPSSSFRAYRQALATTQPPCIPYIGLILQDLTFVHIGNPDLLPDGSVNFTKRLQQYHIMQNMKRFHKDRQYDFRKNERIQAMFNEFNDFLSEEAMWQVSETIKPRGPHRRVLPTGPPLAQPTQPAQTAA